MLLQIVVAEGVVMVAVVVVVVVVVEFESDFEKLFDDAAYVNDAVVTVCDGDGVVVVIDYHTSVAVAVVVALLPQQLVLFPSIFV